MHNSAINLVSDVGTAHHSLPTPVSTADANATSEEALAEMFNEAIDIRTAEPFVSHVEYQVTSVLVAPPDALPNISRTQTCKSPSAIVEEEFGLEEAVTSGATASADLFADQAVVGIDHESTPSLQVRGLTETESDN